MIDLPDASRWRRLTAYFGYAEVHWSAHMKVSLRTYGGLMGAGQPAHTVADATLNERDRSELRKLVAAAAAEPHAEATGQVRDAQTYEIEINDNGRSTTLEATDGSVPQAFSRLRDWLRNH